MPTVTADTIDALRNTRFYAINLDRRAIRAKPYPSERASTADGNGIAFRGSHLKRQPRYASFEILDEAAWHARLAIPHPVTGPDGDNPIGDEQIRELRSAAVARDEDDPLAQLATFDDCDAALYGDAAARARCAAAYNAHHAGKDLP